MAQRASRKGFHSGILQGMGNNKRIIRLTDFNEACLQGWDFEEASNNQKEAEKAARALLSSNQNVGILKTQAFGLVLWAVGTKNKNQSSSYSPEPDP